MNWHDAAIALGQFLLLWAPVEMLWKGTKVPLRSSVLCTWVLGAFAVTFADLGLWLSFSSSLLGAIAWAMLTPRGLVRPKETGSYFWDMMNGYKDRVGRGSFLFNYNKDSLAMVTTDPESPNVGVVIVGNRKAPSWESNDQVEVIGLAASAFVARMAPQPKAKRIRG